MLRTMSILGVLLATGCTGAFKGPMYSAPYRLERQEVIEACERFRKDAEESSGMWSLAGYGMMGTGTVFVAGGSGAAVATEDTTLRVVLLAGAALGATLVVFSKGAFETSTKNSAASANVARALRLTEPAAMNTACLDADVGLRFGAGPTLAPAASIAADAEKPMRTR